jgi:hypothetical protein
MRAPMRERSYQNGCRSRDACPTESLRPLHAPMRKGSLGRTLHTSPGTPPVLDARRRECRKHNLSRELERLRSRRSDAAPAPTVERRTRSHAHSGRRVRAYARPRASGASRVPTRSGRLLEVRTRRPLVPAVRRCDWMKAEMRRPSRSMGMRLRPSARSPNPPRDRPPARSRGEVVMRVGRTERVLCVWPSRSTFARSLDRDSPSPSPRPSVGQRLVTTPHAP